MNMRWKSTNTEDNPTVDKFYYAEDTVGQKTMVHFYDRHWHSLTGHPIAKWLDESESSSPSHNDIVQEMERVKSILEITYRQSRKDFYLGVGATNFQDAIEEDVEAFKIQNKL